MPHNVARHDKSPKNKRNPKPSPIGNNFGFLSFGSPCWARTSDNLINSQVLCHIARYVTKKLTRLVFLWSEVLHSFFAEKLCE